MIDLDRELRDYAELMEQVMGPIHVEAFQAAKPARRRPNRRGLAVALAAAALMILVIAAVVILDPFGSEGPFIEEPTTIAITTPSVTEAVPPTTTAVVEEPTTTTTTAPVVPVITWERVFTSFDSIQAVALVEGGFIAVGGAAIWRSSDGVAWERIAGDDAVFGGEGSGMDVAARGDAIVVVGTAGPSGDERPLAWTSTDAGQTWQRIELEGTGRAWAVTATDDHILAAGDGIWTSTDGVDWRPVADDGGAYGVVGIAHSERGFVAVGNSDTQTAVWTSQDGEVWQRVPHDDGLFGAFQPNAGSTWINDVIATTDGFIAVGASRNKPTVWTSLDGYNWSRTPNQPAAKGGYQPITAITQAGNMLIAVGFHEISSQIAVGGPRQAALAWISHDNGQSWRAPTDEGSVFGPIQGKIYPIDVVADGTRLVAVGYRNDEGAVWTATIEH
jgi:hypothetical protein